MAVRSTRRISRRQAPFLFEVALPEGAFAGELQVDAELVSAASGDRSAMRAFRYRRCLERPAVLGAAR